MFTVKAQLFFRVLMAPSLRRERARTAAALPACQLKDVAAGQIEGKARECRPSPALPQRQIPGLREGRCPIEAAPPWSAMPRTAMDGAARSRRSELLVVN